MRKWMPMWLLVVGLVSQLAVAAPVDTRQFVEGIAGVYRIVSVNSEKPKKDNSVAEVAADPTEAFFAMPYCPPGSGLCDPGYLIFEYGNASVVREARPAGETRYVLTLREGGKRLRYTWSERDGVIRFTNHQYELGGVVQPLEYVLEKEE